MNALYSMKTSARFIRKIPVAAVALTLVAFVAFAGDEQGALAQGNVSHVGVGGDHTCFVTQQKQVKCAGDNHYGQLGNADSSVTSSDKPVFVVDQQTKLFAGVEKIFAGSYDTCALKYNGSLWCWGDNAFGQLTDATTKADFSPVEYKGLTSPVREVAIGFGNICVDEENGALVCSGTNDLGKLANGSETEPDTCGQQPNTYGCTMQAYPVSGIPGGVIDVATSQFSVCALSGGGDTYCWGGNNAGELGQGSNQGPGQCQYAHLSCSTVPVKVNGLPAGGTEIVAGQEFFCQESGAAPGVATTCWGRDSSNEFGHPPVNQTCSCDPSPAALTGAPGDITQIAAGGMHICIVSPQSGAECLGDNYRGQLARGSHTLSEGLGAVTGAAGLQQIAAGGQDTCAVFTGGIIKCAGNDSDGQLGFPAADPSCTCTPTLTAVPGLNDNALPHIFDLPGQVYHPNVVAQKTGETDAAWLSVDPDHTNTIYFAKSDDGGKTWSDAKPVLSAASPAYVTGVTMAGALVVAGGTGITYIAYVDHGAGEGRLKLTSSTDNTNWTAPVTLGTVLGDGAPQIAVTQDLACPVGGAPKVSILWGDYSSVGSGSGDAYLSQFKVGDAPPSQPVDLGPVNTGPAHASDPHGQGGDYMVTAGNSGLILRSSNADFAVIPTTKPVRRVKIKAGGGRVEVIWETDEVPPALFWTYATLTDRGVCDAPPVLGQFAAPMEVAIGSHPQQSFSFASGPGPISGKQSENSNAVPLAAGPGLVVVSWIEACCQGKFHLLNTVSTDGGATWSPAKEVAPPNDFVYGQSVAILGNTIWNVVTSSSAPGPGQLLDNIEVAASVDGGATYKSYNVTSDNVSSAPVPFFLSASADAYVQSAAALATPPPVLAPIILTWQHKDQAGDKQLAVEPLSLAGDSSCDNVINVKDLLAILKDIAEAVAAPCQSGADTNCDGGVGVDDAFRELLYIGGIPKDPPAGCVPIGY